MSWGRSRTTESNEEEILMKTKHLLFVSCLAVGALIASPSFGKQSKKSASASHSKKRVQTTEVTRNDGRNQKVITRTGNTRYYGGGRYAGTRSYAGRQLSGTRYYDGTRNYGNYYGGGTRYYYSGGYPYGYYSGGPYSNWGVAVSSGYYPYSYWGGYPYSGYNNYYSYYTPRYGYNASMVAAVQRRLGQLGYYRGAVDGIIGPQTRSAIAAFESRNGLAVDGIISGSLLDRLDLA